MSICYISQKEDIVKENFSPFSIIGVMEKDNSVEGMEEYLMM